MNGSLIRLRLILFGIIAMLFASNLTNATDQQYYSKEQFFRDRLKRIPLPVGPADDPPPQPAVAVAEWEPSAGVLIAYPLWIPIDLVREMAEDCEVMTVVANEGMMQQALHDYVLAGADTSNCTFLFSGPGFVWPHTRDYGPWYIFNGDDELGIIDNGYWGFDHIPELIGDTLGIPVYSTGMVSEGGNYMTDGMGMAIDEEWLLMENPNLTVMELNQIYEDYLGITNHIITDLCGAHIDTWAKFLDPGRIVCNQAIPPNPVLEANVEFLSILMSSYGRPYEIIRIQGEGYSNTLFLNNKILVPQFGNEYDLQALETYAEAMPGYEVHGFYYDTFSFGDALHCRTHEMADRYMLRIVHVPIPDRENDGNDYYLEADIHPYSNEPLVGSPYIMWKLEGGDYNAVPMTLVSGDTYSGYIPQQPNGSDIYYYLEAEDCFGRLENHPYIGSGNPHHFHIGPDTEPPVVDEFNPPAVILAADWPLTFTIYALDNRWISSSNIEYSINGAPQPDVNMPLLEPYAVYYEGTTEGDVQTGDIVEIRIKVVDTSVNMNTTFVPETGYHIINVASPPNVTVELTPSTTPVQIPANGGSFDFNISVSNNTTIIHTFDIWTMITVPGGSQFGPMFEISEITLNAMSIAGGNRTQFVPSIAPAGDYTYDVYIGDCPDVVWNEDHFDFEKLATGDGEIVQGWDNWGEYFTTSSLAIDQSIPTDFALHPAYPNPFNPNTTLKFDLPKAGEVSLVVYDVMGREVARLIDGWRSAGNHQMTFDAASLPSGIYFARLQANGLIQTRKLLLIK